jgi:hypothetical protein
VSGLRFPAFIHHGRISVPLSVILILERELSQKTVCYPQYYVPLDVLTPFPQFLHRGLLFQLRVGSTWTDLLLPDWLFV